jgi:diazepam-binding inhibitor (GABA receptor modulating acyl-CoA-binding protein)
MITILMQIPMITNSAEFILASNMVKKLKSRPTDSELLELYGLYKQATVGDINIEKPYFFNLEALGKWNAWNSYKGLSTYDSEVKYVKKVNLLIKQYDVIV